MAFHGKAKTDDSKRQKIARLGALTLVFSYLEMILPRPVPFLRLGLANAVILCALSLDFPSFFVLCVIKSVAGSLVSGTLFSPFFLISITQSIFSGLAMYALNRISPQKKLVSVYGISVAGSAVSSVAQVLLCRVYLGQGVLRLLGIMLVFSVISGIVTAFLSIKIKSRENDDLLSVPRFEGELKNQPDESPSPTKKQKVISAIKIAFIITFSVVIFMTNRPVPLAVFFVLALIFQIASKRRILILPHVFMWIFIFFFSIFTPSGKIIWEFRSIQLTDGALILALCKSLKLSCAMCLSQSAANIRLTGNSLVAQTLAAYAQMAAKLDKANLKNGGWKQLLAGNKK